MDGSLLETNRATPKEDLGNPEMEARSRKLFIGGPEGERTRGHSGLTEDISDTDLEDYFNQFGRVLTVDQKVWQDSGKKRGYGYIEFDDEDAVDKIVLMGIHVVKGVRLCTKKGLNKEQIRGGRRQDYGDRDRRQQGFGGGFGDRGGPRDRRHAGDRMSRDNTMGMMRGGPGDKSMAMMSSMQSMMRNMMNMCNQMMTPGQSWDTGNGRQVWDRDSNSSQGWSNEGGSRQGWDSYSSYNSGYNSGGGGGGYKPAASSHPPANYSGPSQGYGTSGFSDYTSNSWSSDPQGGQSWSGGQGGQSWQSSQAGGGPLRSQARDPRASNNPYNRN